MADGDWSHAIDMLLELDGRVATLPVGDFLTWLPGVGNYRAEGVVKGCFRWYTTASARRSLGSLDPATRIRLAIYLDQMRPNRGKAAASLRDRVLSEKSVSVTVA